MIRAIHSTTAGLITACCVLAMGCSKGDKTVPVEGTVLIDGKPAAGATVTLHPVDASKTPVVLPVGQVDESGNFRLTSATAGDGAAPGEYRVTVTWYVRPTVKKRSAEGDEPPAKNQLSDKYARPDTTPLKATVTADRSEPLTIQLKRG